MEFQLIVKVFFSFLSIQTNVNKYNNCLLSETGPQDVLNQSWMKALKEASVNVGLNINIIKTNIMTNLV